MKILIVEDDPNNILAAKHLLVDHEVTFAVEYEQAYQLLTWKPLCEGLKVAPFDIVLTDINLPLGKNDCCKDKGKIMPYGPFIALRALSMGIKKIGLLTSGNHHKDSTTYALDNINCIQFGNIKVVIGNTDDSGRYNCCMTSDGSRILSTDEEYEDGFLEKIESRQIIKVKNWSMLLKDVLA